jgi:DNA-binding transcriptional ArsR family regulator
MPRPIETKNNNSQITSILKAISNMMRLQILNELADGREKSVLELERVVPDLSQSALSQHLGRLRHTNIVKIRRESQYTLLSSKCRSTQNIKILNKVVCK